MIREQQIVKLVDDYKASDPVANQLLNRNAAFGLVRHILEWADSHPAWVSVEDEPYPPKKNKWDEQSEEVLVYGLWCGEPTMAFGEYYYDIHEWGLKGLMSDVTHWMPLPQPPVKKGGEQ